MGETVYVVAVLTAKPGQRHALIDAFAEIVEEVRAEAGCITYVPAIDTEGAGDIQSPYGSDTLVVVEEWESLAHLDAHGRAPHMQAFSKVSGPLVADRKIHVLSAA